MQTINRFRWHPPCGLVVAAVLPGLTAWGCATEAGEGDEGSVSVVPEEISRAYFAEESCCEDDTPCQDGLFCNGRETCNCWGECEPPDPTFNPCYDADPCTSDDCDELRDRCPHRPLPGPGCPCSTNADCNDSNPCTQDICDAGSARCTYNPVGCDDGNPCTVDTCDPAGGCTHTPVPGCCRSDADCHESPDNPCTTDRCDRRTGTCTRTPVAPGTPCSDGLWCNGNETCNAAGVCVSGTAPCSLSCQTCDEPTDTCLVSSGCLISGVCYAAGAIHPANPCQWCDPAVSRTSWSSRPAGTSCNDGLFCTATDTCDGSGRCAGTGTPCSDGLICTTDTCDEAADRCTYPLAPGYCLISGVCYANGTVNPANSCEWCWTASSTVSWSPLPPQPNDTCAGSITLAVGGSHTGNTMCAVNNYVDAGPCGRLAAGNDITYGFSFTTGNDYQLYHYRVAELGSGATPHPDPFVYTRTTCTDGSPGAEWRCNNNCSTGFTGTNYTTGCGGLPGTSGVVVVNPTPVGFSQTTSVITDGTSGARGTVTTSVTREAHNNNACTGTAAYHASPNMFPGAQPANAQDVRWRGHNMGYGDVAGISFSCGSSVSREATWRISTQATPRIHFYYDELALAYDGSAATNPFDGVLQLLGPDPSGDNCTDAGRAGCGYHTGRGPASVVLDQAAGVRNYWLALGSAGGGQGQYELRAMVARAQFAGIDQWFPTLRPASSGGANFDLQCTRLDFTPNGSADRGYTVTWSALPGCGWAVNPAGMPGAVTYDRLTVPWNYDDCSVNYPIGFNFLWGEQFYSRVAIDTNGRVRLTNDPSFCSARCFDYSCGDYTADRNQHYTTYQPELAVLWTDLVMCEGWWWGCWGRRGYISRQLGPVAAPTGEVITATVISWVDHGYYNGWGGDVDFQLILYIDGRFSFVYRYITGSSWWWPSNYGIVGISGTRGVIGTAVNFR